MSPSFSSQFEQVEDSDLLQQYVNEGSQDAFSALVRRRIGLVYSVALRQMGGDRQRAEDATQIVFDDLAHKAHALCNRPVLAGWLYRSARLAAAALVRAEHRRQRREQEAHNMEKLLNEEARDEDWQKIRPVLDDALSEIDESDRDAIVLRFFDGRPFGEIGVRLRLSENTARMRVQRALDQLNAALARRGVRSTAGALSVALANQISAITPAGLATSVAGTALAQSSAAASGWLTAFVTSAKAQLGIVAGFAAAGAVGYVWQQRANAGLQGELSSLHQQQQTLAALRTENERLTATVAEVEGLRRDDAEFKRLAQLVDETRKANEEKARLANAEATARANTKYGQAEIARMNREGNVLVNQHKSLVALGNDPTQTAEARAMALGAATQKFAEIRAKQREVQAFIAARRANDPQSLAWRSELRDAKSIAGEISFRKASRAEADAASGEPGPNDDPDRVSFSLPKADLVTALSALENAMGRKIIRDPSLAAVRGTVDFSADKLTMREAAQGLAVTLRDQLNVVLEPNAEGALVAKVSGR